MENIIIKGAREHNLKNLDLTLPRDKLIVISGVSGSGKSSLAFDTIFAEGQRRYVESLSAYARQFLGRMNKPDLDYIEGLSPAISIEQKTTHSNPRSTVGTITEIYDYLRLLYANIGHPHCPKCGRQIEEQSLDQIMDTLLKLPEDSRVMVLAPLIREKKGEHRKVIEDAKKAGFSRVRVNGEVVALDQPINLNKNRKQSIDLVVDRIIVRAENRKRLTAAVETSLEVADGKVIIMIIDEQKKETEHFFSQKSSCLRCNISLPELQPRLFSFNSPYGACVECSGLGITQEFDPELIITDPNLSYNQGLFHYMSPSSNWYSTFFAAAGKHFGFSLDTPFNQLSKKNQDILLYGNDEPIKVTYVSNNTGRESYFERPFRGVIGYLRQRFQESTSDGVKIALEKLMSQKPCETCRGKRLRPEALAVTIGKKNIDEITHLTIVKAMEFFSSLSLGRTEQQISSQIMKEISSRLSFLASVGLDYLTMERTAATLSGGEMQRIRLATQIGASLVGVLYILDEPSIGLHQRDNERLLQTLLHLRDIGNTLIVVEHDEQTLRLADHIVDLGPGAGVHGGQITASGTPEQIISNPDSLTGRFLNGSLTIDLPQKIRTGNGHSIEIVGTKMHNLRNINVVFPLGKLVLITGVSGSGKSTLINDILYPAIVKKLRRKQDGGSPAIKSISGIEHIDKIINIDQSPIGRTPRSNPATYVGLFTPIRDLFAGLPESKARGYRPGRFSFNVSGGRCENCHGDGTIKIEMHFLPDVYIPCDVCKGKRFNNETLEIRYKGKNIHEVLQCTVEEACNFFSNIEPVFRRLKTLMDVGLGYIKLGQSALTLSGGEAQRVKLSLELAKKSTGKTIYLLDEPTTGLHFADIKKLLEVIHRLVDMGNSAILIEHNLDVIKQADHIIDLGPEGGDRGGQVVVSGTPEEVVKCGQSHTGHFLRPLINQSVRNL